jgi:hypothetical protein
MPFHQRRTATLFGGKEILRSAAGLDDVKSMVVDSSKVPQNPASSGRYVLERGTVMLTIGGSDKIQPATAAGAPTPSSSNVVGILEGDHEFWLATDSTPNGNAADEPVGILHHGCNFNTANLVAYVGNETAVKAALPTCKFT